MTSYRLYLVSDLTRRLEPALEFDAQTDRAAFTFADKIRSHRPAELWSGNRLMREWAEAPHSQWPVRVESGH